VIKAFAITEHGDDSPMLDDIQAKTTTLIWIDT